jgi:hypothetical protein
MPFAKPSDLTTFGTVDIRQPNLEFLRTDTIGLVCDKSVLHTRRDGVVEHELLQALNCAKNKVLAANVELNAQHYSRGPREYMRKDLVDGLVQSWFSQVSVNTPLKHCFSFETTGQVKYACCYIEYTEGLVPSSLASLMEAGLLIQEYSGVSYFRMLNSLSKIS